MPQIVRQVGKPKRFRTYDGRWIDAKDKIFIPEYNAWIPCAPYDNHTIYETGFTKPGTQPYMCTCGAMAVIVGWNVYKNEASPQGLMFVCHHHATFQKHADGSS